MNTKVVFLSFAAALLLLSAHADGMVLGGPLRSAAEGVKQTYAESTEEIVNPGCGFYKALYGSLHRNDKTAPFSDSYIAEYAEDYGLLHLIVSLEDFSTNAGGADAEIDENAQKALAESLSYLRVNHIGAIIRFNYNPEGKKNSVGDYLEAEPDLNLLLKHIEDVSRVEAEYSDVVLGIESGMLGPWGEQHSTALGSSAASNASTYYSVVETWLKNTPGNIGVTVRRPLYFLYWANIKFSLNLKIADLAAFDSSVYPTAERVGVYNDGYLGSSTDLGTFTDRAVETAFIGRQAEKTYYGGEAVVDENTGAIGMYNAVSYLEKEAFITHTSYLNTDWNTVVFEEWRKNSYNGKDDAYKGKTTEFTYVKNHLGYRFYISEKAAAEQIGNNLRLCFTLRNVGFAGMFRPSVSEIVFSDGINTRSVACPADLSEIPAASEKEFDFTIALPESLPSGNYNVYLRFATEYGKVIRLANGTDISFGTENGAKIATAVKSVIAVRDKFLVTFDGNYGILTEGNTSQIVKKGESAIAPVFEREGYRFVGWDKSFDSVAEDIAVTAVWERIPDSSDENGCSAENQTSVNDVGKSDEVSGGCASCVSVGILSAVLPAFCLSGKKKK